MFAADGYAALGTTAAALAGRRPARRRVVSVRRGRVHEGRGVRRVPEPTPTASPWPRSSRASRASLEGFGQVPIPPLYWMSNTYYLHERGRRPAGRAARAQGSREPARHVRRRGRLLRRRRRQRPGDGRAGLPAHLGRAHHPGLRRGLRHVPLAARQHARHVPPPGAAAAPRSTSCSRRRSAWR